MTDPWKAERDVLSMSKEDAFFQQLLDDADALLTCRDALRRIAERFNESGKRWTPTDAAIMHEDAENTLAAIPEHLRRAE